MNCTEVAADRTYQKLRVVDRDTSLVEALRCGEPTAVERLIATYGDRAYRLASGITGTASDAETSSRRPSDGGAKIHTFRGDSALGTWIYRLSSTPPTRSSRGRRRAPAQVSWDQVSAVVDEHGEAVVDWSARVEDPGCRRICEWR